MHACTEDCRLGDMMAHPRSCIEKEDLLGKGETLHGTVLAMLHQPRKPHMIPRACCSRVSPCGGAHQDLFACLEYDSHLQETAC